MNAAKLLLSAISLAALASPASAENVKMDFAGTFANSGFYEAGTPFTTSVSFKSGADGIWTYEPDYGYASIGWVNFDLSVNGVDKDPQPYWESKAWLFPDGGLSLSFLARFNDPLTRYGIATIDFYSSGKKYNSILLPSAADMQYFSASLNLYNADGGGLSTSVPLQRAVLQAPSPVSAVPEPATWAMMIFGFGFVGGAMRRRRPVTLENA